jgi:hypothetical protein
MVAKLSSIGLLLAPAGRDLAEQRAGKPQIDAGHGGVAGGGPA